MSGAMPEIFDLHRIPSLFYTMKVSICSSDVPRRRPLTPRVWLRALLVAGAFVAAPNYDPKAKAPARSGKKANQEGKP